jgi:hypothetical protein
MTRLAIAVLVSAGLAGGTTVANAHGYKHTKTHSSMTTGTSTKHSSAKSGTTTGANMKSSTSPSSQGNVGPGTNNNAPGGKY